MWMRGLRRCIIEMAMRLENGDPVVFVVPTGPQGSSTQETFEECRKWAANSSAKEFYERGGKQYLALPGKVNANSKGRDIVNGLVSESEALRLIQTNDGISIELDAQKDMPANEKPWPPPGLQPFEATCASWPARMARVLHFSLCELAKLDLQTRGGGFRIVFRILAHLNPLYENEEQARAAGC